VVHSISLDEEPRERNNLNMNTEDIRKASLPACHKFDVRRLDVLQEIPDHRDIISLRNILVHGYDTIDDRIVWSIIEEELDALLDAVGTLLQQKTTKQEQ